MDPVNWDDHTESDPIKDLRVWQEAVVAQTGLQRDFYAMSEWACNALIDATRHDAALRASLRSTLRRRVIKRYKLRRQLGQKRLSILVPWPRFHRAKSKLHLRWLEFKHRNDPWWF